MGGTSFMIYGWWLQGLPFHSRPWRLGSVMVDYHNLVHARAWVSGYGTSLIEFLNFKRGCGCPEMRVSRRSDRPGGEVEPGSEETLYYSDLTTMSMRCKGSSIYDYPLRYLGTPSRIQKDEI